MALQTFTLPDNNRLLPNTNNPTSESGESWREVLVKAQAMFTELYAALVVTDGIGAVAGAGVSAVEYGNGAVHKTVLTFVNTPVVLADEAGVVAFGGLKVYDFPEGFIHWMGGSANLTLGKSAAGVNADWDGDFGLGTTAAGNNNALATTEQDLIPTTATPQASASLTTAKGASTATEAGAIHDGHTTPKDAFLNILIDDADHDVTGTPTNIVVNGTITLVWANLGDYT